LQEEKTKQLFLRKDEQELWEILPDQVYNQELRDEIKSRLNYSYPYQTDANLKVKMTVSELKKIGQFIDEEQSLNLYAASQDDYASAKTKDPNPESNISATIPQFIQQKETDVSGTDRGTLYHKALELIDIVNVNNKEELRHDLERLIRNGKMKVTDVKKLKLEYINSFINSSVDERMRKAHLQGKLYKEKQFVIGLKAAEVIKDMKSDELILVQGIIDVFFEEEGELVLLDYKSDQVKDEGQLIGRYKVQLEYYRKALEQMTKKRVKEMIIYSLSLGKEIRING